MNDQTSITSNDTKQVDETTEPKKTIETESKKELALMKATCESYIKLFKFIEKLANERNLIANVMSGCVNFKRWQLKSNGILRTFDGMVEIDISKGKITPRDIGEINGFLLEEIGF